MRILLALLFLAVILPAYGSVIAISGVTDIVAPSSVQPGQLLSDSTMYIFSEQIGLTLTSPVYAGITEPGTYIVGTSLFSPGTIAAGTTVNSYLLRAGPVTDSPGLDYRDFTGTITFSPGEEVVGIIFGNDNISLTDPTLGSSTTLYPPASFQLGGLENNDEIILSVNKADGADTIYVNFHADADEEGMDMIRIVTTSPEPADLVLMASGLAIVAFLKRRTLLRRARR